MPLSQLLAKHLRDVHFGGNWTSVNLKEQLSDLSWQQVNIKIDGLNSIAALVFHMNYYVRVVTKVLMGGPLDAKDALSFDLPPINCEADWKLLQDKIWADAERFATIIEHIPESQLWEDFTDPKYGTYYRNLQGITEHLHYHLGQVVVIRKLILFRK